MGASYKQFQMERALPDLLRRVEALEVPPETPKT